MSDQPKFRTPDDAKKQTPATGLNGQLLRRRGNTIFIPLPPALWQQSMVGCCCQYCSSDRGRVNPAACWDTLAMSSVKTENDRTYLVHAPELHLAPKLRESE